MSVLIVEDDADILSLLRRAFQSEGYQVNAVPNGEQAMEAVRTNHYDTIILDLMLPGMSGIHVCEKLRLMGIGATILILSARDSVADRIEGLNAGADDYVVKPFSMQEVLARVKAQARHHRKPSDVDPNQHVVSEKLRVDLSCNEAQFGDRNVALTERECDLLVMLIRRTGEPLSREEIFEALWADQGGSAINLVDVYVGYLRKKLTELGLDAKQVIRTVRGTGFMFRAI